MACSRSIALSLFRLDWAGLSPFRLGDLFQAHLSLQQWHSQGVHYTHRRDLLKVIDPLFMDDLKGE